MQEIKLKPGALSHTDLSSKLTLAVEDSRVYNQLQSALTREKPVSVTGLPGTLCAVLLTTIANSQPLIVVTADSRRSEELLDDLYLLLSEDDVCFLPPAENTKLRRMLPEAVNHHRAETLRKLASSPPKIMLILPGTLTEKFPSLEALKNRTLHLKIGSEIEPYELVKRLLNAGFRREIQVAGCGETALRGGILDLFPYGFKHPLRLEFWGNEISSIRLFDPRSQLSIKEITEVEVFIEKRQDLSVSVFSLMDGIVFWDDMNAIRERYRVLSASLTDPLDLVKANHISIIHNTLEKGDINFRGSTPDLLLGSAPAFKNKVVHYLSRGISVYIGAESEFRKERFLEFIEDFEGTLRSSLKIGVLPLQSGFIFEAGKIAFFTERELFDHPRPRRSFARFRTYAHPFEPDELKMGDFVVHSDFGIGIFQGLKKIKVAGCESECLHLKYRDEVSLYVRLESFDKVWKYSGREGFVPAVSKIGGRDWYNTRKRAKKALLEMAKELLLVQAKRQIKSGIAFDPDDLWQKQLEDSFVYTDTPDQFRVSREVKEDMERDRPMDRLILGDVGFGKTEIAVRAAFKAVRSDHQVALLAPTTILVQQHLQTFRARMQEYPINIESLSRFNSPAEQRRILQGLKNGSIDIVIGTHRLLSQDVNFRHLGLLIIDEEHRFGVRHKERLKHLREEVDVLTLTATPIPRTLNLALLGTRDLSRIETPPENRLSIITEVAPFDKGLIREAMLFELNRSGQVFFVHNRVRSIGAVKSMLSRTVPEATFDIAHGQMKSKDLEKVMFDFLNKKFDCLICTMIVESGLDLPNVNTMIVNRADKMGLAQLYQLRGRIGRSDKQAYAYLLIPPKMSLTKEARTRLETISHFSELGAGFQVALKDLEIRGAGNLLGAEQSGFINSVGFDLYSRLLEDAVIEVQSELSGDKTQAPLRKENSELEIKIDLDTDIHIPENYIFEQDLRVNIYRKLASCGTNEELMKLEREMKDRFGSFPKALNNLFCLLKLKILSQQSEISALKINSDYMNLVFKNFPQGYRDLIQKSVACGSQNQIEFSAGPPFSLKYHFEPCESFEQKFLQAESFLLCIKK